MLAATYPTTPLAIPSTPERMVRQPILKQPDECSGYSARNRAPSRHRKENRSNQRQINMDQPGKRLRQHGLQQNARPAAPSRSLPDGTHTGPALRGLYNYALPSPLPLPFCLSFRAKRGTCCLPFLPSLSPSQNLLYCGLLCCADAGAPGVNSVAGGTVPGEYLSGFTDRLRPVAVPSWDTPQPHPPGSPDHPTPACHPPPTAPCAAQPHPNANQAASPQSNPPPR